MSIGDMLQAQRDAEDARRYRWLKSQDWTCGTLSVVKAKGLRIGTQTYSNDLLDERIDAALAQSQGVHPK